MWSAFFFSRYSALTAPLSIRDPLLGLGTKPCTLRPRLQGKEASEEHQLRSDETNKQTVRAQQKRQHATHSPRKVTPFVSCHKKGSAPEKQQTTICQILQEGDRSRKTNCVISQERERSWPNRILCHLTGKGPLLKNKQRPQ